MAKLSDWLRCKKLALAVGFTEEEIDKAMEDSGLLLDDITDKEDFEKEPSYFTPRELIKDWHTGSIRFTEMSHKYAGTTMEGWRKAKTQTWRIPAKYQGLRHEKFVRPLLKNRFPWFDEFRWDIYSWDYQEHYEIYLRVDQEGYALFPITDTNKRGRSLYVPVKCLVDKDKEGIVKRNTEYWNWYYNDHAEHMLTMLDTETAQKFFEYLKG